MIRTNSYKIVSLRRFKLNMSHISLKFKMDSETL